MDRETAVKLWREIGLGMPGGGATRRLIEAFAVAVEAAERERCAALCDARSQTADENRRHEAQTMADLIRRAKA